MNRHSDRPACFRDLKLHACMTYGTPPNLEQMREYTPGCEDCGNIRPNFKIAVSCGFEFKNTEIYLHTLDEVYEIFKFNSLITSSFHEGDSPARLYNNINTSVKLTMVNLALYHSFKEALKVAYMSMILEKPDLVIVLPGAQRLKELAIAAQIPFWEFKK